MASITASNVQQHVFGNLRAVTADSSVIANSSTWATGLTKVFWVGVQIRNTAAAADAVTVGTISGGTVTFEGTSTASMLIAFGV